MSTIDQKIAQKEKELNALKSQKNQQTTEQKIIVGDMFLSLSENNPAMAKMVLDNLKNYVKKNPNLDSSAPLLEQLRALADKPSSSKDSDISNEFLSKPGNSI